MAVGVATLTATATKKNESDSEAIVILSDTESLIRCYADQALKALEQCDPVDWDAYDPTEPIWDAIVKCRVR